MRKTVAILLFSTLTAGCQMVQPSENAVAAASPPAPVEAKKSASKDPKVPAPTEAPVESPPAYGDSFSGFSVDSAGVLAGIQLPPISERDPNSSAFKAELGAANQAILDGSLTREGAAKRLYKAATKYGLVKGKPDEEFWMSLILAYRNLDNRYLSADDVASDINAAIARRAAAR